MYLGFVETLNIWTKKVFLCVFFGRKLSLHFGESLLFRVKHIKEKEEAAATFDDDDDDAREKKRAALYIFYDKATTTTTTARHLRIGSTIESIIMGLRFGWETFRSSPPLFLSLLCVTVFVSSSMTAIENVLNQDVGLTSTPEEINRYYAVSFSAYAAKPVFAFTSDYALGKGRQRYRRAKFASAYCFLAAGFMFGLSFAKTLKQVYGFGILMTVCVSGAYASVDGILVCAAKGENTKVKEGREEEMRRIGDQNTTEGEDALEEEGENNNTSRSTKNRRITQVNVQTVAMATRTFAAILGSACSVLFLEMFTARATIALSSVFAILAAFIALKIEERSSGGVEEGTDVDLDMRRRRSTTTTTTTTIITTIKSKKWPWRRFFRDREFIAIALALFIYRITPTAMDTYNSFVYSIYDEKLPNSAFGMFQFFSSVGALFGAFAFSFFHNKYLVKKKQRDDENLPPGREELSSDSTAQIQQKQLLLQTPRSKMNIFLLGGIADVGFQLVRLFVLYHPPQVNQRDSGTRAAIILSVLELVVSFGSRFAYMPIVILSAVVAEKCENKEAFSFSTLVFFADLSSIFAGFIAADIVERWKIGASVKRKTDMMYITGRSWSPLKNFVYLCAFLKLLAIALTLLLLKFILASSSSDEDEEDEGDEIDEHQYLRSRNELRMAPLPVSVESDELYGSYRIDR